MATITQAEISQYVEANIGTFHDKRIQGLSGLKLNKVIGRKNPYLFKAKAFLTAPDIVRSITDAYISSQEETMFGDWLEGLAVFVNQKVFQGRKSGIDGIDLEFERDGQRYIVAIKSGPNWANKAQRAKMRDDFRKAKQTLRTGNSGQTFEAINGCCYGRENYPDKGDYYKYCGQVFWEFISGDPDFYIKIIEPLGYQAKERNEEFLEKYAKAINVFTAEFIQNFCKADGSIDWDKLVKFNSSKAKPLIERAKKAAKKAAKKVESKVAGKSTVVKKAARKKKR